MELEFISPKFIAEEWGWGVSTKGNQDTPTRGRGNVYWAGRTSKDPLAALCIITNEEGDDNMPLDMKVVVIMYVFTSCNRNGRITAQVSGSKAGKEEAQW